MKGGWREEEGVEKSTWYALRLLIFLFIIYKYYNFNTPLCNIFVISPRGMEEERKGRWIREVVEEGEKLGRGVAEGKYRRKVWEEGGGGRDDGRRRISNLFSTRILELTIIGEERRGVGDILECNATFPCSRVLTKP